MKQERRAYEWSIFYFTGGDAKHPENDDPQFHDELKHFFNYYGKDNPFVKEMKFREVKLPDESVDGEALYGNLEIKLWRLDKNGDWDNDYAQIEDGTGKILPSDYYGWKVPKKYQNELNKYLGSK